MSTFLSEQWLEDVREAVNADTELLEATRDVEITVLQNTTDVPEAGTVQYWFSFSQGVMQSGFGPPPSKPDATMTMNNKTALEVYTGAQSLQGALMKGRVKVSGNIPKLMASQKALNGLMPVIGSVTTPA